MTAFFDAWDSSRRRTSHRCTGPSLSSRSPAARSGSWVVSEMRVNEERGRGVGARERGGGGARSQISRTSRCRRWKWMGSCGEIAGFSRVSSVSSGRVSHAARVFASRPHASSRRPARRRPSRARQSDVSLRIFVCRRSRSELLLQCPPRRRTGHIPASRRCPPRCTHPRVHGIELASSASFAKRGGSRLASAPRRFSVSGL